MYMLYYSTLYYSILRFDSIFALDTCSASRVEGVLATTVPGLPDAGAQGALN